jgi:2-polyprenyl-3-methyl-5-hydroxy-6-metoxy-1,4-benzoquinol methylase
MTSRQDGPPTGAVEPHTGDSGASGDVENDGPAVKSAFVYATDISLDNDNDSHTLVILMVGENKRVLELGCAEGSTTRILRERGCRVTGIEMDATAAKAAGQFAERMIVGDLDTMDFTSALGNELFDVIVAADVLEHLTDPLRCLRACVEHLSTDGEVVLSIPNIAHADVRLTLLDGHFDYSEWGLLDNTHFRFFTRASLLGFLEDCGLAEIEVRRVTRPFGGTEIAPPLDRFPELVEELAQDREAHTYQFVLRAAPYGHDPHFAAVARDRAAMSREIANTLETKLQLEQYREAHRRLMHLVCPEVIEDETVEVAAPRASDAIAQALASVRRVLEQQELQQLERDELRRTHDALELAREDLEAVQRSESFRAGRAVLSPYFAARLCAFRVRKAWGLSRR